jgi:hypothetical protein
MNANKSSEDDQDDSDIAALLHIEQREAAIRCEASIVEHPLYRTAMHNERINRIKESRAGEEGQKRHTLVWPGGSFKDFADAVERAKVFADVTDEFAVAEFAVAASLDEAVSECLNGDVIFLPAGQYVADDLGELEKGGSLVGVGAEDAEVVSKQKYADVSKIKLAGVKLVS